MFYVEHKIIILMTLLFNNNLFYNNVVNNKLYMCFQLLIFNNFVSI